MGFHNFPSSGLDTIPVAFVLDTFSFFKIKFAIARIVANNSMFTRVWAHKLRWIATTFVGDRNYIDIIAITFEISEITFGRYNTHTVTYCVTSYTKRFVKRLILTS